MTRNLMGWVILAAAFGIGWYLGSSGWLAPKATAA